jgi:hypothetical protein
MRRLFPLGGARPRHPAVDRWMADHPGPLGEVAGHWFGVIRACGSDVLDVLHDGHPTACVGGVAFAYVALFRAHLNVGFFAGAELPDPAGLLRGSGQFMRHVKVTLDDDDGEAALTALVQAAYADVKETLASGADGAE